MVLVLARFRVVLVPPGFGMTLVLAGFQVKVGFEDGSGPSSIWGMFLVPTGFEDGSGSSWVWGMFLVPDGFEVLQVEADGSNPNWVWDVSGPSWVWGGSDPSWVWHHPGTCPCHRPISPYSPAESFKPGFVPPRDLSKHSPLIKSQSLISIRRVRGREDGPEPEPSPAPVPSPPPNRERRNVQRTQSVPAQSKATRRLRKQSSAEHVAEPPVEDNPGSLVPRNTPVSYGSRRVTLASGPGAPWRMLVLTGAAGVVRVTGSCAHRCRCRASQRCRGSATRRRRRRRRHRASSTPSAHWRR